ncbi:cytochrome c oxidase subunit 3 [Buchnera aphidicola]|uniref:cytochrome c oxidase subunit 3 n=1 Tax=Buchnera aphidicola TaxID=9 RepID=UPI00346426E5
MNKFNFSENNISKENKSIIFKNFSKNSVFGFWIYMMSDCIIFATMFAVYEVMLNSISNDFDKKKFFHLSIVVFETFFLLLSSLFTSILINFLNKKNKKKIFFYFFLIFLSGLTFIFLEIFEFLNLIKEGYVPQKDGFLSAFYSLLSLHGIHIIFGLLWIIFLCIQIFLFDLIKSVRTQIFCFSIFWHFLDIIWIFLFSFVYLIGAI